MGIQGLLPALKSVAERRSVAEYRGRHLADGNASSAAEAFQRAVVIRPVHNKVLLEAVKAHGGVDFVVAPYEADAQLAFLALSGRVHAVISEDSDLLAYGCPRVLYKMGKDGFGEEICRCSAGASPPARSAGSASSGREPSSGR